MARLVKHEEKGPFQVKEGMKWVCMCGLSSNKPFCDGSHALTQDEARGRTYVYERSGKRREVKMP